MTQLASQAPAETAPEKLGSSSTPLDELKEQLESLKVQASQLDKLKKAIDATSTNVEEYGKMVKPGDELTVGEALKEEFESLQENVDSDLKLAEDKLEKPEIIKAVKDAIDEIAKDLTSREAAIGELETDLVGGLDGKVRVQQRWVTKNQKAFDQLTVKALKERVALARGCWQEANATPATPEGYAEAYALLGLAQATLSRTWLTSDVDSQSLPFTFPADVASYEEMLVEAYEKIGASATETGVAQKKLADAKAALDSTVKELATLRGSRKKDVVNAAKEAVKSVPATTTNGGKAQQYASARASVEKGSPTRK